MRPALPLISALLLGSAVSADIVQLTNGGRIEGIARKEGARVVVETMSGEMTVPADSVASIDEKHVAPIEEYYSKRQAIDRSQDPRDFLQLAIWARRNSASRFIRPNVERAVSLMPGQADPAIVKELVESVAGADLGPEARPFWDRILAADPANETARRALGYRRHGDRWMTEEEFQFAQGNIQFEGRWMNSAERDLILAQRALQLEERVKAVAEREGKVRQAETDVAAQQHSAEERLRDIDRAAQDLARREATLAAQERLFTAFLRCDSCGMYYRGSHICSALWTFCRTCRTFVQAGHVCGR